MMKFLVLVSVALGYIIHWRTSFFNDLAPLTIGSLWKKIYNPPTPLNLSIAAVVLLSRLPHYLKIFKTWRTSRRVVHFNWAEPKEAALSWTGRIIEKPTLFSHLDDETLLPPETGKTESQRQHLTCYDPSTAYHLTTIPLLSADEVAERIKRAHEAQPDWAKTTFAQRKMVLRSLKDWVVRDMDIIVRVACRDTGKTRVDAVFGEILTTLSKLDWLIKYGEDTLKPSRKPGNLLLAHKVSDVHHIPLGTTLALVSWNYSFHNLISPIIVSLFAGNTVVVKCSEQVAWSSLWYYNGIRACLTACGMDPNVVQLVVCLPDVAEKVTRNSLIKHITFIGSEPVGRLVAAAAASIMVPTCIELGGKDPAFIMPDCKLESFASTWMRGAFQSAGQNCIGIELFLVPRSLYPKFIAIVEPRVRALRLGMDVGSLISHTPIKRLESLLESATQAGARVLVGGKQYHHPDHPHGAYYEPTLVVDVNMDMGIANEELFAPVMTVVPYDDVDEALGWLNGSRFGLGAGVYGEDRRECERVAGLLQCGMVSINDFGIFYLNQAAPFGGVKASGHGRFGGEEGLLAMTSTKTIIRDRFFSYIRTSIPRVVDFPLPDPEASWAFLVGLVGIAYGGVRGKIQGLYNVIRLAGTSE
ncbi:putative meiotic recombination-related protein [Naematelia encephala]|uniref:Putative meiotic recombination-related protein n=1 Tax=Naematelia encephala TaxID=71784 RepID=A0A1Y2BJ42_9TREE|nr:putative meiotic recombination-related protein [Naematelia encephala]